MIDIKTIEIQYKEEISVKLDILNQEQSDYIKNNSKYLQKKRYNDGDLDIEVHEYLCPNGSIGYQVFFYKKDGENEYIKSIGYGQEADSRTYGWKLINNKLI